MSKQCAGTALRVLLTIAAATCATLLLAQERVVARVGDVDITESAFVQAYEQAKRQRYYHGSPPEVELTSFRQNVMRGLVSHVLLVKEAERRNLVADATAVESAVQSQIIQARDKPGWDEHRDALIAHWQTVYEERDLLRQLESSVRTVLPPTDSELKHYYHAYPEKFTEPTTQRVSLILLSVTPSAISDRWSEARQRAAELVDELRRGADFETLARQYSGDASAMRGGDMGYLHSGMLSAASEAAIAALEQGEVTDPVNVLEGVAIFRLDHRRQAQLQPFEQVVQRVRTLWMKEAGDNAWQQLNDNLRKKTTIAVDEEFVRS